MTMQRPPALVFGGTFDPPHRVHVAMARAAADALGARAVLVIPAAINPQRVDGRPPAPGEERLAMARIAFRDEPRAAVLDLEIRRAGPSYTVDTLRALHDAGEAPLRLLVGSDQALNLPTWRSWEEVVRLAPPAIVVRPPFTQATLAQAFRERRPEDAEAWIDRILPIPPVAMASTDVRAALAGGAESPHREPPDLDPAVLSYLRARDLYRTSTSPASDADGAASGD